MMGGGLQTALLLCALFLLFDASISHPMCIDSRAPSTLTTPLKFCSYNGSACCNSTEDSQIQKQYQSLNITRSACASLLKSILCARCDPFSAELFLVDSVPRTVPILCNSTVSANSSQSLIQASNDYCSNLWETCQNVSIANSPFAPSSQGKAGVPVNSNVSELTKLWKSEADFCNAFGGVSSEDLVCFSGEPVKLNYTGTPIPPHGLCLEKIGNGSYLNMVAHPDGSNRAFFATQEGKVYLGTIPEEGSGEAMGIDESNPFVDLTDQVHFDTEFGIMGMAFHPNFAQNGRFFASFNCDKEKWPGCSGRCSCNSEVNCDPSKLGSDSGAEPCQYHSVIAEYTANGTASTPSLATSAKPTEVRRIFTMGLPFNGHHAGQILFGPEDGYLYFTMGDGGGAGDPYGFAQNKKSLLGKIMRLDVDNVPSASDFDKLVLWGNYSIPKDNPFNEDPELRPEIWASGLRNPWRCSFDSEDPSYFICADIGQDLYEEVDVITKGGNYGWNVYEGPYPFIPPNTSSKNRTTKLTNSIFPIMGFNHSEVNKNEGSASITGGYIYRSTTDPCMYGRYVYGDLFAGAIWAGSETPENSGNFSTSKIPFKCGRDSPIPCTAVPGSTLPALGYVFSFGEDNRKDLLVLSSFGVYRVVRPSRCSYTCSKENVTADASPDPSASPSDASWLRNPAKNPVLTISSLVLFLLLSFV